MSSLDSSEKKNLLGIARRALVCAACGPGTRDEEPCGELMEEANEQPAVARTRRAGVFVTLRARGRLRGCIGQLSSELPLADTVAHCARAAAREDPRFAPVKPEELSGTEIEISVLSTPVAITPEAIRIGEHGLIVSRGKCRGVLLPHVATEFRWQAQRFLEETCVKAGLATDAWKDPETEIQAFTADVFTEKELIAASSPERARRSSSYSSST